MVYTKSMKIEFVPSGKEAELLVPSPKPAKAYIPDWYKKIRPTDGIAMNHQDHMKEDFGAIKRCMPFFDALNQGYIQETWTEIYIKNNEDGHLAYAFPSGPNIVEMRKPSLEIPEMFYPFEFAWKIHWMPKLPKGWSALITSPNNRFDLPFRATTGIVDSDLFYGMSAGQGGNYPFYLNKGFEGIIPVGTPMYQIIPFKRENWKSTQLKYDEEDAIKKHTNIRRHFVSGYKKEYWQKKTFD